MALWLAETNRHGTMKERRSVMIPLVLANPEEPCIIKKLGGTPEVKKHLENLGFNVGSTVTVVTTVNGNLIVKVKESRVAVSEEMARKIMI